MDASGRMHPGSRQPTHVARLSLDGVSFWYPGARDPALQGVSLTAEAGETIALIGTADAGCSTLLLVAAGLAPRVTGGRLDGAVTTEGVEGSDSVRALLLAAPWVQVSGMARTVRDEVAFGPANLGWPVTRIRASATRALEAVGVAHLADRDPLALSGGELQRVILAGLLAMEPDLLLLDEPTAELDAEGAAALWRGVQHLRGQGGSVLVATSALDAVPEVADRVVWLSSGRVRAAGAPRAVFEDEALWHEGPGGPAVTAAWRAAGVSRPWPLTLREAIGWN